MQVFSPDSANEFTHISGYICTSDSMIVQLLSHADVRLTSGEIMSIVCDTVTHTDIHTQSHVWNPLAISDGLKVVYVNN